MTVFFDMDGVLANFDKRACEILNTDNSYKYEFVHGSAAFWDQINVDPRFFAELEMMPGIIHVWNAVVKAGHEVAILTAIPDNPDRARIVERQKREWVLANLGEYVSVSCCLTEDKPDYCSPSDILIDDRAANRAEWIKQGGIFLLHESPLETWDWLKAWQII